MKRLLMVGVFLFILLSFSNVVYAESFSTGSYLAGEFITKEHDGVTYYLNVQYIKDANGNVAYCLEPYVSFEPTASYSKATNYNKLSAEQLRKIELLTYYGYGYKNRTDSKWYAITQYLIWTTVDSVENISFTTSLNGNKFNKYASEKKELLDEISVYEETANIKQTYEVDYGDSLTIEGLTNEFSIVDSPYETSKNGSYVLNDITESGVVSYVKNSNYYNRDMAIYTSKTSQALIRTGNLSNSIYDIDIVVLKGNIKLDIKRDKSVYSSESTFTDTCYEITDKDGNIIDTVCTKEDDMSYESLDLPYGDYSVKQISVGIGFLEDTNIYNISIGDGNTKPNLVLYNYLLKNKLELNKHYCVKNNCSYESNAKFGVYDKSNKLVKELTTSGNGYTSMELGYGSYVVKQLAGKEDYDYVDDFGFRVVNDGELKSYNLYDNKIEEKKEPVKIEIKEEAEEIEDNEEKVEELPPDTGINILAILRKIARCATLLFYSCLKLSL